MKLHLKLHLTFINAFIPRFYSIACLSKLHSIITSLRTSLQKFLHKITKTGTILVVADELRSLAPPAVYTGTGCRGKF